jgi:hypothetical protein
MVILSHSNEYISTLKYAMISSSQILSIMQCYETSQFTQYHKKSYD